jgi:GTP diphosphokinase / guanosine-3',5'-bis(diphosphate) 3'-diphosphatase
MATLERAIEIAARAHAGQIDKGGEPYILHPLRVMQAQTHIDARIAAVLHDVVEDTEVSFAVLEQEGFSPLVVEAVKALTKLPGEKRLEAAARAVQNPIARVVKLADVADNMDLRRLPNPTERDYARLEEYKAVRALLQAGGAAT